MHDRALLEQVTEWSISAACAQAAEWRGAAPGLPQLCMSVDLPVQRLTRELADKVLGHLRKCKLPHGWLELDVGEHLLIGNSDAAPVLAQLKAAGVRLAVDDFGSASASLATLRELALDVLKIDSAFVRELDTETGVDMAAAIIHLGRALGMRVLAKGVERDGQLTILNSLGCDQYQGDLFSPAAVLAAVLALLQAQYTDSITSQAQKTPAKQANPKTRGPRR
ncbi:EAL domain-containing protein [Massilia sp. H-1]|nr:EAL domain-containing protein [Massilia sp. H-1]